MGVCNAHCAQRFHSGLQPPVFGNLCDMRKANICIVEHFRRPSVRSPICSDIKSGEAVINVVVIEWKHQIKLCLAFPLNNRLGCIHIFLRALVMSFNAPCLRRRSLQCVPKRPAHVTVARISVCVEGAVSQTLRNFFKRNQRIHVHETIDPSTLQTIRCEESQTPSIFLFNICRPI